jgi:uncharacterized membrane protein YhaH (DUF805 family)
VAPIRGASLLEACEQAILDSLDLERRASTSRSGIAGAYCGDRDKLSAVSVTFDTQGRIGREEYGRAAASMQLGAGATSIVVVVAGALAASVLGSSVWVALVIVGALVAVFALFTTASLALAIRRMHDLGATGWWLAPAYGASFAAFPLLFMGVAMHVSVGAPTGVALFFCSSAVSLALLSVEGQPGANRYGAPPPAATASNPVVVHATPPRDLSAELFAARVDLDAAKSKLTR